MLRYLQLHMRAVESVGSERNGNTNVGVCVAADTSEMRCAVGTTGRSTRHDMILRAVVGNAD
jgi:hypothetical protein